MEAKFKGAWSKTGLPEHRIFQKASARRSKTDCDARKKIKNKKTQPSRRREVKSSLVIRDEQIAGNHKFVLVVWDS